MMRRTIAIAFALGICTALAHAEPAKSPAADLANAETDVLPSSAGNGIAAKRPAVSAATVGDPHSFGRDVTYLGVASTDTVILQSNCTGVSGNCVTLNPAPASTSVNQSNLASITLPPNSTNSLICFSVRPIAQWTWFNGTGADQMAQMSLRPKIRIENPVLSDPSLGLGGAIETTLLTFFQQRTLEAGERDFQLRLTSRDCGGGLISKRRLQAEGLTDKQIRDFFRSETTLNFGVTGDVSMVTSGRYFYGIRLYGD